MYFKENAKGGLIMAEFYLDFETKGINPEEDKIITIQYQQLDSRTGKKISTLNILKEWESSEKDILNKFIRILQPMKNDWSFIPVGFNLKFEFYFLYIRIKRMLQIELPLKWFLYNKPFIDIKPIFILINQGKFKGTKLSWFTNKPDHGHKVPGWYEDKNYSTIIDYIRKETDEFIQAYCYLKKKLPPFYQDYNVK